MSLTIRNTFCSYILSLCLPALASNQNHIDRYNEYIQDNCSIGQNQIEGKINPQTHIIHSHCTLKTHSATLLAPVGSSHPLARIPHTDVGLDSISMTAIPVKDLPTFGTLKDGRQRSEWTTGFFPIEDFLTSGVSPTEVQFKSATKSMMQNQWPTQNARLNYELRFKLPTNFHPKVTTYTGTITNQKALLSDDMSVIIAQWHGTPDRLTFRASEAAPWVSEKLELNGQQDQDFLQGLHHYHQLKSEGNLFDQGGFPPMALKIKQGRLALIANSFRYPVHDRRLTRCPKVSMSAPPGQLFVCDYTTQQLEPFSELTNTWASAVSVIWQQALNDSHFDRWIHLKIEVKWPRWQPNSQNSNAIGTVNVFDMKTQRYLARYQGPIGNHDQSFPYFKFGIYKSSGSKDLPVQVDYEVRALKIYPTAKKEPLSRR